MQNFAGPGTPSSLPCSSKLPTWVFLAAGVRAFRLLRCGERCSRPLCSNPTPWASKGVRSQGLHHLKATATRQSSSLPQKALFHHLSRVRKASTAPQCPRSGPDGFMG